jgi:PAS domain S-box-containing protein
MEPGNNAGTPDQFLKENIDLARHDEYMTKLSNFAVKLAMLSSDDNLEAFIARELKSISGAEVTVFSEYNSENRTTTVKHIEIDAGLLKNVIKLLGKDLNKFQSFVDDKMYREMTTDIVGMRKTLYEASLGAIMRPLAAAAQKLAGIDRFIGLAYLIEGELYGTSLLGMGKTIPDLPKEILENFASMATLTLRRRKAEIELKESEEKYRTLFKVIPDIVFILDQHSGKIEEVNDRAIKTYGYSESEFLALYNINVSAEPEETRMATENGVENVPVRYHIKKDGTVFPIEMTGRSFMVNGTAKFIALARDITERKQSENELQKKIEELAIINAELEQFTYANQELKQFAYTASHQLQEPIRTISNYIQIIEEDYSEHIDKAGKQHLQTIRDATKRMGTLINSLLEFSRLGRNIKLNRVDCEKVIKSVISDLEYLVTSTDTRIEVGKMPVLNLYETEFHQLFQNLITNAIKFQKKGNRPEIHIRSEKIGRSWKFSVNDNGIGIAPDHFERIFELFQRLYFNEDEYEGKGIGLAYCKKIVQLHQGEIWVESKEGEGATFYFTINI